MTTITWRNEFLGIILVDEVMLPNKYKAVFAITVHTDDKLEQNMAFERLQYFMEKTIDNTLFACINNPVIDDIIGGAVATNIAFLPKEPYDQIIAMALHCKLNVILEGKMTVDALSLSSHHGDDIEYIFGSDDSYGLLDSDDPVTPWWFTNDAATIADDFVDATEDEINSYQEAFGWNKLGFTWDGETAVSVVKNLFKPRIIDGGKKPT
jgi:hypothetical protein